MYFLFFASTIERKNEDKSNSHPSSITKLPLTSRKAVKSKITKFPHQNKGFISYVFCRNWAVRNPAGTRLDPL